jgi:DNA repair protein RecO
MSLLEVTGIVLNRRDVREDSRLYTIFTNERGKIEGFGRGIRKGKAKLVGHIEPGATVRVTLAQGKTGETITAVERMQFPHIATSTLTHIASLSFTLGLVDAVTKLEDPDPQLATFLQEVLDILEKLPKISSTHARFRMWVAWHVFRFSGLAPETERCVHCRKPLQPQPAKFSTHLGGWLDDVCISEDVTAQLFPFSVREFVQALTREPWHEISSSVTKNDIETKAAKVTKLELEHITEKQLPVERFVTFSRKVEKP